MVCSISEHKRITNEVVRRLKEEVKPKRVFVEHTDSMFVTDGIVLEDFADIDITLVGRNGKIVVVRYNPINNGGAVFEEDQDEATGTDLEGILSRVKELLS